MKEARFYQKIKNNFVRCETCGHSCVIGEGEYGLCGVRKNKNSKLISLVYGRAAALNVDPIEKKPLFHFLPGSLVFSLGTFGCNFSCAFCQNWTLSQPPKEKFFWHDVDLGKEILPAAIVSEAIKQDCLSIAYTYNEPTVFLEYAFETMKIAREAGLKNVWVSNGYMSQETLNIITPYLDAINIDLKSFRQDFYERLCGASLNLILENLKKIKTTKIWLEITTLLIPGQNDTPSELKDIANFIERQLGKETPWHISAFSPAFKMMDHQLTQASEIEKAVLLGKQMGLKYVYAGNIRTAKSQNTYCPKCQELIIERSGSIIRSFDQKSQCPRCKTQIDLILE